MSEQVQPAVGQVWQDNDPRLDTPRYVHIKAVEDGKAVCQAWYRGAKSRSRTVRIRLDRFRPVSTGYRYLRAEDES